MLWRAEVETSSVEKCELQISATKKDAGVTGGDCSHSRQGSHSSDRLPGHSDNFDAIGIPF